MVTWPVLLLWGGGLPQSVEPGPSPVDRALLREADQAQKRGDTASLQRWLRGWATIRHRRALPEDASSKLKADAAEAMAFAEAVGTLRVYASLNGPRVIAGVFDPAGIVHHLEARGPAGLRLPQSSPTQDRWTFQRPQMPGEITVSAMVQIGAHSYAVRQIIVSDELALPEPPTVGTSTRSAQWLNQKPPPRSVVTGEPFPWWWMVAIGAGAAAVGSAIVFEAVE